MKFKANSLISWKDTPNRYCESENINYKNLDSRTGEDIFDKLKFLWEF